MSLDGLVLRGRLVKVVAPREYKKKDGTLGESYPALILLAGEETAKVEYRTVEARDEALAGWDAVALGDGMVPSLPEVEIAVRASGQWDAETRSWSPVRLSGVLTS